MITDTQLRKKLEEKIELLYKFPGNLDEFNSFLEEKHVVMKTGRYENFVREEDQFLLADLVNEGCVGLIHYNPINKYGVPVAQKKGYRTFKVKPLKPWPRPPERTKEQETKIMSGVC